MKRSIAYPLIALLILSLIACGVLFMDRQSLKIRLQSAEEQMNAAQDEVGALVAEKELWIQEKKAVGKTIGTVKNVLLDTLKELDDVTDVFKVGATEEPKPTEGLLLITPQPTEGATAQPKATAEAAEPLFPKATDAAATEKAPAEKTEAGPVSTPQPLATVKPTPKK